MPFNRPCTGLRRLPLLIALALGTSAQAQSLVDLYAAARGYDAVYLSAKAQFDATLYKADQARALWLPKVGLGLNATRSNYESDLYSPRIDRQYNTQSATLSASQSLYHPADDALYSQSLLNKTQAAAALKAAEQDLIVRLSQAYFDVLSSSDSLAFVTAQKSAVQEQLASAQRNFEVGTATITDTREAQARYDLVIAQEIAAANDLRVKLLALAQLVGQPQAQPKPLAGALPLPVASLAPGDIDQWVDRSQSQNSGVQQLKVARDVAALETTKARAAHLPTVDLVASYQANTNNGSASYATDYGSNATSVGVSLNVPLFAGYSLQNRVKETIALEAKAQSDLEAALRQAAQSTRTAYYGVESGLGQVKAYEAAERSSQSALDANRLGYQVGVRINIDVLNAQSQLFDTKAKLAKARHDVLVGSLRLRQAGGTLEEIDLQSINSLLAK